MIVRIGRLPFLVATVFPVVGGCLVAARQGYFNLPLLLLTLLGASAGQVGANMANDYYDSMLGADWKNKSPTPFSGGSRVVQDGLVSQRSLGIASYLVLTIATLTGLYLVWTRGLLVLLFLFGEIFLAVFYTAPPLKLVYRGLGEVVIFFSFGVLLVNGSFYVQAQHFSAEALALSIPLGLLVTMILYVNEIPDRTSDRLAGKLTLPVKMGKASVLRIYKLMVAVVAGSVVLAVAMRLFPIITLITLGFLPVANTVYKMIDKYYDDPNAIVVAMAKNVMLLVYFGTLVAVGYILSILLNLP